MLCENFPVKKCMKLVGLSHVFTNLDPLVTHLADLRMDIKRDINYYMRYSEGLAMPGVTNLALVRLLGSELVQVDRLVSYPLVFVHLRFVIV